MTMTNLPLMIFAAGFGTRMGTLTRDRPKPMIRVGGRMLIDRALDLAAEAGTGPVMINIHYMADMLAAHLADRPLEISRETPEILDTGGGLKQALIGKNRPVVATMNPDVIWDGPNPLRFAQQHWDAEKMDALLVCVPLSRTLGRDGGGDFGMLPDGRISRHGDLVYGGVQILRTGDLAAFPQPAFSLNAVWDRMATKNRLYAVQYPGRWCDVGSPAGLSLAEKLVAGDV